MVQFSFCVVGFPDSVLGTTARVSHPPSWLIQSPKSLSYSCPMIHRGV
jgi:hypothetical protein